MITQERLKELLRYDPKTGNFIRLTNINSKNKKGCVAGTAHTGAHGKSYVIIKVDSKAFKAHRLAFLYMTGEMPQEVDHNDGNGVNNKWENLTPSTSKENAKNRRMYSTNTSGFSGITWRDDVKKYRVRIGVGSGKRIDVGHYEKIDDAIKARVKALSEHDYHQNHGSSRPL